jgi:mannosyltransferase
MRAMAVQHKNVRPISLKHIYKWVDAFFITLLMLFALFVGLTIFTETSLRLDEAQSLFQTNRDISGTLNLVAQDVHVPLYHLVLHISLKLFGSDIMTARLLSLVFFIATIPLMYATGKYLFSRKIGLFAALLIAVAPFMNWYASEARMYSMLTFITLLHQLFFMKIFREGKSSHWVGFGLTAIAGLYTHYFFIFVLLTEAIFYLMKKHEFTAKKAFRNFILVAIALAASIAPWLYYVYTKGAASNTQPYLLTPSSGDLFNTYAQFLFGFQIDYLNTIIVSAWPLIVLLAFLTLQKNKKVPSETIFLAFAAILPVAAAFLISVLVRPSYSSRYLIVSIPALFLFISWIISHYPHKVRRTAQIGLVSLMLITFAVQALHPNTPVKENYSDAVSYLNSAVSPQDVIIAAAPFTIYPIEYYYKGSAKITTQPQWNRFTEGAIPSFNPGTLESEVKAITGSYQTAWLILSYDQGYNELLRQYYDNHFEKLKERTFSQNLTVSAYRINYNDPIQLSP